MNDWVRDWDVVLRRETEVKQTTIELGLKGKHGKDITPHDNNNNNNNACSLRTARKHDHLSTPKDPNLRGFFCFAGKCTQEQATILSACRIMEVLYSDGEDVQHNSSFAS